MRPRRAMRIGIAGAGLLGRLIGWSLAARGHEVDIFDAGPGPQPGFDGRGAAAFTAAGMLSPLAELDACGPAVAELGVRSLDLWARLMPLMEPAPWFRRDGSLLVAHRADSGAAQRVLARLSRAPASLPHPSALDTEALSHLEPELSGSMQAWLLPDEGQLCPVQTMAALHAGTEGMPIRWHWSTPVAQSADHELMTAHGARRFDLVFDVRGVGAREAGLPSSIHDIRTQVRGVRGETVWLQLDGHGLRRPVRLLHPRHRVYIVPRPEDLIVIGASEIESEDRSEVSLRTSVELMAAAHSVMPSLAEARVLRMDRNLRPALPDNEPRIEREGACVRINGLFRHGWLLAPAMVEDAFEQAGLGGLIPA